MAVFNSSLKIGVIMEYLVKIGKKARILELKRRHLKITVLTSNTSYPSMKIRRILIMTKVIKEEFKKLESLKMSDDLLICNTPLEIFNEEFNRMSRMDDDLFTYEVEIVEVTNIPCDLNKEDDSEQQMLHESDDDMEYDPSDARGDDEVELNDEESSDSEDEDEVANIFRIETNVFDFKTPLCRAFKEFNYLLQIDPDVHERPWTDNGAWEEPTPVRHHYEPFNYKYGCSKWPTCSWKDDGYCNGRNLPGAYIVGNTLRYQDLEWYEALKDSKLKEEALKNKVIKEGMIDEDDESSNEGWRRWDDFNNEESKNEMEHENEERCTDNAKIIRKQSKLGKHGHENGRIHKSWEIAIKVTNERLRFRGAFNQLQGQEASYDSYKYKLPRTQQDS
ncbi:hypothetical protein Tco_0836948 [Tanacetum coccineum]